MIKNKKIKNLLLVILLGYVGYILVSQQIIMHRQKKEIKAYNVEAQKLKDENKKLQDEINLSKSDKYIEKLAREKLGLVKEGETPVIDRNANEK